MCSRSPDHQPSPYTPSRPVILGQGLLVTPGGIWLCLGKFLAVATGEVDTSDI